MFILADGEVEIIAVQPLLVLCCCFFFLLTTPLVIESYLLV